ncbi:MAG: hypothetical protein COA47_15460 [Robiginitomaculum sp.]|nr:MAG: hypothetical protein COA47_15460 [Robiginitomaculum sp.]
MGKTELINARHLGQGEKQLWTDLRSASSDLSSPYFSPEWTAHVAKVRKDIQVAVLHDDNQKITGFLPLQRPKGRVALPVGGALNDYHGIIAAPGLDIDLRLAMRDCKVGRFDFSHVPASQQIFERHAHINHGSHVIDLSNGLETYRQSRLDNGSSETKRARKRKRKLDRDIGPVRIETYSQDTEAFAQLMCWKRAQYKNTCIPDVFAHRWTRDLVQNLFEAGGPGKFGGALFLLYAGDQMVAANFCLADGDILHAWFVAHDRKFARYSPGQILFESMIDTFADSHIREIDLGAGDYRFKTSLASFRRPMNAGFVAGCPVSAMVRAAEYKTRNWIEGLQLGRASLLPGKAMRRFDTYRGLA